MAMSKHLIATSLLLKEHALTVEGSLLREFIRRFHHYSDYAPRENDELEWFALMQHHGAPTRLLDWSDGALMALHFAVRNKSRNDPTDAIVYAIDPFQLGKHLDELAETKRAEKQWKTYVKRHPLDELSEIFARASRAPYTPDPLGLPSAREVLGNDVILTASTSEAYSFLFKLLADPGDAIVTAVPSYPLLEHLARRDHAELGGTARRVARPGARPPLRPKTR